MADFKNLKSTIQDRVAYLTVNRPEVLNALDEETLDELEKAFSEFRDSEDVGVVILRGAGEKAFVAGVDIKELADLDALGARAKAIRGQALFERIETFPKPVIGAINGFCLGGGCELAMVCHIRIATENATFGQPEVKLGIIPGYGGTQRWSRLVGKGLAMEVILSGEMISAAEAQRVGLVSRIVSQRDLMPYCRELAAKILSNAPLAVRYSIEAINRGAEMPLHQALGLEATLFGLSFATQDMQEGMKAFLEKRASQFRGR